jgi:hypothetical protein
LDNHCQQSGQAASKGAPRSLLYHLPAHSVPW